jgi:REP element-mobilizing transposase RayT
VAQSIASIHLHLVFSTKNREPLIDPAWADRLYEYTGGIVHDLGCVLVAAGGIPDHVHYLVSLSRTIAVADLLREVKGGSSEWVHKEIGGMRGFAWQGGYGAFGVSYSQLGVVKRYIANQADHHRVRLFQEEYREFLRKHGEKYDERYVWDCPAPPAPLGRGRKERWSRTRGFTPG